MEAARQDMDQEAANELVGRNRHDLLPVGADAAVVLVAEGDAALVECDQAAVRDSDAVSVARQVGEHRLGAGERRLGVNHPALLADRNKVVQECPPLGEVRHQSIEAEPPGVMQTNQPREKEPAE